MINNRTDIMEDYELVIIYANTCAHVSIITRYSSSLESLRKRRFCQQGRQPEVSCVIIEGVFFEINNGSQSIFTFMISNENG